jgi:hypothetical protein
MMQVIDLGFRPRPWQADSLRRRKRFNVEVVHRRGGKTVVKIMRLIDAALRNTRPNPRYGYVAPLLKQAKAIAWDYLKNYARKLPGCSINESELYVEFPNGARIRIFGADNPDSLRGLYFDGVVLDEVADMKPEVWTAIILPAILDRNGWADFIGTPKGINLFSELYYKALKDPEWFACLRTVYDTGALSVEEIELARSTMPEAQFRQEFLCDFTAGSANALLSVDVVHAACGKHLREEDYSFAARIIGVDVARQGDDRTVIFRRQGLASFTPIVLKGADAMQVAARVAAEYAAWQPDAVMVDGSGGYGAGVIDRLRQLHHTPLEVQFGGKADDARFANKRTEMFWKLAEWVRAGAALPDMPELKVELCTPTYSHDNARGVMKLESKDDIKERMGYSPDLADALALTFAYPVQPRARDVDGTLAAVAHLDRYGGPSRDAEVYNPMG